MLGKRNQRGISLLETLVAIVIIFLVLIAFFRFFIHSGQTNTHSESIQNATYIAQQEMEKFYTASQDPTISKDGAITSAGYNISNRINHSVACNSVTKSKANEYETSSSFEKTQANFKVVIKLSELCDYKEISSTEKLVNILINVYQHDNTLKATIENIYVWK